MQVNVVYNKGSTGKIVSDTHKILQENDFESIVCYGRGEKTLENDVYKVSNEFLAKVNAVKSRITGLQYNGSHIATRNLIEIIKKENPDVVHLQCMNGYFTNIYKVINFLKENRIKTVLTLHAEFMYTGGCGHSFECTKWMDGCGNCPQLKNATKSFFLDRTHTAWVKMKKAFEGFDTLKVVSVSNWLDERATRSPILAGKNFSVIENGIDTNVFSKKLINKKLKEKWGIKDEKVLLHVTANFSSDQNSNKGGHYIIELAKKLEKENIKIIVASMHNENLDLPSNIICIGRTKDQLELAEYYSMADLTILTSKRETFSMPCIESLACGTPVVGFKAGGPEQVSLKDYSEFVDQGDLKELEKVIYKWIDKKPGLSLEIEKEASERYSKENMLKKYIEIYKN